MNKKMTFDSRIIEHMGKDLITSPEVALIELIKNSIDASVEMDKGIVNIKIYSSLSKAKQDSASDAICALSNEMSPFTDRPCILVEDFGVGMSESVIETCFLNVGTRSKMKEQKGTLFGQKGIGRLAAQRLGSILVVETTAKEDSSTHIAIIDWTKIVDTQINEIEIPFISMDKNASNKSYTRLWILDAKIDEIVDRPLQESLIEGIDVRLKEDVASALAFLISPYETDEKYAINVFYDNALLPNEFNRSYLMFAESIHSFNLMEHAGHLELTLKMELSPFYIEKIHKTRLGSDVDFLHYKLEPQGYIEMYKKYKKRYEDTLVRTLDENELITYFENKLKKIYDDRPFLSNKERYQKYINEIAVGQVENLRKIAEISGRIFSFKRDNIVGALYVDFVKQLSPELKDISVRNVQTFLRKFNGVKLYRNNYRIGFLGNKDNDWIEMQQYRTMGQQFYRFNLGDTLGYVKINDDKQKYIKEISSRLDIYTDEISRTFKDFINYIFNEFFYGFNKSADDITRSILMENGLIESRLPEKVKKAGEKIDNLVKQNKKLIERIIKTKTLLDKNATITDGNALIPTTIYHDTISTLSDIEANANQTQNAILEGQKLVSEASVNLNRIEIEAFNNYKLMANGLITETITHELHSLVNDKKKTYTDEEWTVIGEYLIASNVALYNKEFLNLKNIFETVVGKINDVSELYGLLESTFVKGNSKTDYDTENIEFTINRITRNFVKDLKKQKIDIEVSGFKGQFFIMPKGVMLHVFYNLIANSIYWIDYRKKKAKLDNKYNSNAKDYIKIILSKDNTIEISDSGTGVLPNMEHVLFEALQSGKEANEGRGMGLYIIKKMLNSFDADISLDKERNAYGNRYKFIVHLPYMQQ